MTTNAPGSTVLVNSSRISAEIVTCNRVDGMSVIIETSESFAVVTLATARFVDKGGKELFAHEPVTVVAARDIRAAVTFPFDTEQISGDDRFADPRCELTLDEIEN